MCSVNFNCLSTASGRFYSGMTLDEAKSLGCDKSTFKRDFRNLDMNKDGVLSDQEIINERDLEAQRKKNSGIFLLVCSAIDIICLPFGGILGTSVWDLLFDVPFTIWGSKLISDSKKLKAENEEIKKQFNVNV